MSSDKFEHTEDDLKFLDIDELEDYYDDFYEAFEHDNDAGNVNYSLKHIEARKAAEARLIATQAEADAEKVLADAAAHAIKVKGEAGGVAASAYINEVTDLIDELLVKVPTLTYKEATDIILGIIFYDTWNGELPEVLTSDSLSALIGSLIK